MRKDSYSVYFKRLRDISQKILIYKKIYDNVFKTVIESGLLLLYIYIATELYSLLALYTRLNLVIYKILSYKTST